MTFLSGIFSAFTGLLFVIIVIRRLSPEDFGLWMLISVYASYFVFPSGAISYWITRYAARGLQVSRTGLYVNGGLALLGFLVYSILAPYMAASVEADVVYFYLGGFMILLTPTVSSLIATAYATKPEVQSYGSVAFELAKVILGALIVAFLRLGLSGAIATIILADLFVVGFLLFLLRDELQGGFNGDVAKKWVFLSWIPIFGSLSGLLISLDTIILSNLTGSTLPKAYMEAPTRISGVISSSSLLAYALYPKLLGGGGKKDVETAIKLVLLFAVPLTVGGFILAKPLLYVLREEYSITEDILRVLALVALFTCISGVFDAIITGTEWIELRENATFKDYLKSKIFLLPALTYVQATLYIPSVIALTYYATSNQIPYVSLVFYCVLSRTITAVPIVLYKWLIAKRIMEFKIPWANLVRYLAAAGVMAIFTLLFYPSGAYTERILYVLSNLLPVIAVGALIYLGIAYIIDRDAKALINSTSAYLKQILRGRGNAT